MTVRGLAERDVVADVEREQKDKDDGPDVLAREAAHILADAIDLLKADHALAMRVLPAAANADAASSPLVETP